LVSELFFDLVSLSGSNLIEEIFIDKGDKTWENRLSKALWSHNIWKYLLALKL
jgi:hypothetical protein